MAPREQRFGNLGGPGIRVGSDRVQYRRLAHARLTDEDGTLAAEQRDERRDVALRGHRHHRVTERREGPEARDEPGEVRLVRFVRDEREAAPLRLGGDDPAVDQLLVDGEVRRDDADDLRHVRRDQLLPEFVGAEEQRAAGLDRFDRAAARRARDAHPVAAGKRRAAAFQHALDRRAAVEAHGVVATTAGGDEAGFEDTRRAIRPAGLRASRDEVCDAGDAVAVDRRAVAAAVGHGLNL